MKQVGIRDLRYRFAEVESLLAQGQEIEITRRKRVVARLSPPPKKAKRPKMPDFRARMKAIFGDTILTPTGAELLAEERDRY